jgi:hypothetical protein
MTTRLEKSIRRELPIRRGLGSKDYVVTVSRAGVELREKGRRFTMVVPWSDVLARAEHLAGESARRERLRTAALRRIQPSTRADSFR